MVFSSVLFLFYFLPVTLILYFIAGRFRNYVLLALSLFFYYCGGAETFPLILASILLNYISGVLIGSGPPEERAVFRKACLILSMAANLGLLFYYKYFNFAGEIYSQIAARIPGLPVWRFPAVTLPIGISFFTFQGMAYVVDVYRGQAKPQKNILKIALYISMFPQLIAGPIVRYTDIAEDMDILRTKKGLPVSPERAAEGAVRFIAGLAKKVIIADVLAENADRIFAMEAGSLSAGMAWFGAIAYALQIYFDFSGYSDMAIGIGKIFGYDFPENFNLPYISRSVREFWRRWHMTLSTWFRDYLYIPLGGNRRGNVYVNLLVVFLCTGLWHGAAWNFVAWGLWHGMFLIAERLLGKAGKSAGERKPAAGPARRAAGFSIAWVYTMLVVVLGWVVFRSEDLAYAVRYIGAMFGAGGQTANYINIRYFLTPRNIFTLITGLVCAFGIPRFLYGKLNRNAVGKTAALRYLAALALYVISLLMVINGNYSPFIYFRF